MTKIEYVVEPWLKSTRSQPAADQFCTEYPAAGVAETSFASVWVIDSTTEPPFVSYRPVELVGDAEAGAEVGACAVEDCDGDALGECAGGLCPDADASGLGLGLRLGSVT
ncbi:MAG: hypothetical protein ACRDSS_08275, partial [Actinocrinis sp.]